MRNRIRRATTAVTRAVGAIWDGVEETLEREEEGEEVQGSLMLAAIRCFGGESFQINAGGRGNVRFKSGPYEGYTATGPQLRRIMEALRKGRSQTERVVEQVVAEIRPPSSRVASIAMRVLSYHLN